MRRTAISKAFLLTIVSVLIVFSTVACFDDEIDERRQILRNKVGDLGFNAEKLGEEERFDSLVDLLLEDLLLECPSCGSIYGFPGADNDRVGIPSKENREIRQENTRFYYTILSSIDRSQLPKDKQLSYDLLLGDLNFKLESGKFPSQYLSFDQMWGFHQEFETILSTTPSMETLEGYENYLARMRYFDDVVGATINNLREGLRYGITPPRVTLHKAAEQINGLLIDDPLKSPYLKPFVEFPEDISGAETVKLRREASNIYSKEILPSLTKFSNFLTEVYILHSRETIGMSELPNGQDWYALQTRRWTTTNLTPEEIHQIGLSEVEVIRSKMVAVKEEAGFEGSLEEFGEFLRTDPQFTFQTREELLTTYRNLRSRVDSNVGRLFGRFPRLDYEIIPVPAYAEQSVPDAYYQLGSVTDNRPGRFFVNTYNPSERHRWGVENLFFHEAVPGHHFQIALGQELEGLPWFRQIGGYGAFVEGWGLYAETLGEEMGFYQDPYSKYGQLIAEQWRAVRLVVDTGIHALGWSRGRAIQFFREATAGAIPDHMIEVEVDRYIVMPGQALSYKIGQLQFRNLRNRAEEELGDRFDVRAFHDLMLGNGALPLGHLERIFNEWLAQAR